MATVRNLACIAFRPEALDVHNLGHSKLFISYFCKVIKKIERIFAKNFARNYEKKIILGTSDVGSPSRLAHKPSDPAYHIED